MSWAEGYPKAVPAAANEVKGAVELFGSYEVNPGWALKEAQFSFTSSQGGEISKPVELQFAGGKWGRLDAKDKTKVVPARVPMDKGKYQVRVQFLFEGKDASGQPTFLPYQTTTADIEIK